MVCLLASQYLLEKGCQYQALALKLTVPAGCELQLTARHAQKFGLLSYCSNAASADFWTRESWLKDCLRQSNKLPLSSGPRAGSAAGVGIAIGDGQVVQQTCGRGAVSIVTGEVRGYSNTIRSRNAMPETSGRG